MISRSAKTEEPEAEGIFPFSFFTYKSTGKRTRKSENMIQNVIKLEARKRGRVKMTERFIENLKSLKFGDHLCSLYENGEQQFSVVVPFLKHGLENNEKCVYVADENTPQEVKNAFKKANIDVQKYFDSGQLSVVVSKDFYIRDGEFESDAVIRRVKKEAKLALREGYKGLRLAEEATWALKKTAWLKKLTEYEVKLDSLSKEVPVLTLCQYNKPKFTEEILIDVIKNHPIVLLPGLMCRNRCCYIPPSELFTGGGEGELAWRIENLKKCRVLQQQFKWWQRYSSLERYHREAVDKFVETIIGLDEEVSDAFIDLFGKRRYGSFSLVFKAGKCIGFDWKASHRAHKTES